MCVCVYIYIKREGTSVRNIFLWPQLLESCSKCELQPVTTQEVLKYFQEALRTCYRHRGPQLKL